MILMEGYFQRDQPRPDRQTQYMIQYTEKHELKR